MRSGLAARLGNAGGGAIALSTFGNQMSDGVLFTSRINTLGSYDLGLKYKVVSNKINNLLSINHHRFKGNRDYSTAKTTTVYNTTRYQVSDKLNLTLISGFYISPEGNDPGALTEIQFKENRWQPNARNLQYQAGEAVKGAHIALKMNYSFTKLAVLKSLLFYRKRDFLGKLPTENNGIVDLNRNFVGITNSIDIKGLKNILIMLGH
ncbi:MAG: hypothetical protein IPO92_11735 [Saprospiraceae bacterium]|nr:hypothetical protein [Saprospiraceae bacterium]